MLRVMTVNVNGIRSAAAKGFFEWFLGQSVDILCLQETKAQLDSLTDKYFGLEGYHVYHSDAVKKGYSGVAIYTRIKPNSVTSGIGLPWFDEEGRHLRIDFDELSVISLYLPSGTTGDARQRMKYEAMAYYDKHCLQSWTAQERHYIICGDWNIAHTEKDLKNWKQNRKNSGFLPDERAWLDQVFDQHWVDAFRSYNQASDQYTWWSYRSGARQRNVGWRIDYQVVSSPLIDRVESAHIMPTPVFSDHAPLVINYQIELSEC